MEKTQALLSRYILALYTRVSQDYTSRSIQTRPEEGRPYKSESLSLIPRLCAYLRLYCIYSSTELRTCKYCIPISNFFIFPLLILFKIFYICFAFILLCLPFPSLFLSFPPFLFSLALFCVVQIYLTMPPTTRARRKKNLSTRDTTRKEKSPPKTLGF